MGATCRSAVVSAGCIAVWQVAYSKKKENPSVSIERQDMSPAQVQQKNDITPARHTKKETPLLWVPIKKKMEKA